MNRKILIEDYKPVFSDSEKEDDEDKNLINTPFGVYKMNDSMNPIRQFTLKMVNVNFSITTKIKNIIDNLEGIEIFFLLQDINL